VGKTCRVGDAPGFEADHLQGLVEFLRSLGAARIAALAAVTLPVEEKLGVTMTEIIKAERG